MADAEQDQKTEGPSDKKLREAHDRGEFARSAELAADPAALTARAAGLRDALRASPLLDHAGQARRFGDALQHCWETSSYAPAQP